MENIDSMQEASELNVFRAENCLKCFVLSAGWIILATGLAKLLSAFGKAKIMTLADPVFGISFGRLILLVGILELIVSIICLFTTKYILSVSLVAWMAINIAGYRAALWLLGWHRPCPCLGNLTDAIHIPPQLADSFLKVILAYLLIGSSAMLVWFWKRGRESRVRV